MIKSADQRSVLYTRKTIMTFLRPEMFNRWNSSDKRHIAMNY